MNESFLSWYSRAKKALDSCREIANNRFSQEECRQKLLLNLEEINYRLDAAEASMNLFDYLEQNEAATTKEKEFLRIKYQRLNVFRITILDLSETCELIAYCHRVSRIGNPISSDGKRILSTVLENAKRYLRSSSSDLVENGHGHVTAIRNSVVHKAIGLYFPHIAPYQTNDGRIQFELDMMDQPPKELHNEYFEELFDPLCQLGTRPEITDNDFLRTERRRLMNGLFSVGKLVADMMEALVEPLESEAADQQ